MTGRDYHKENILKLQICDFKNIMLGPISHSIFEDNDFLQIRNWDCDMSGLIDLF